MRTRLAWQSTMVAGLAAVALFGCVGGQDDEAGPCGGARVIGRQLWQVGNCEVGTLTPVSDSCEVTICSDNAREPSDCTGDKLFHGSVDGERYTFDGGAETIELTRTLDCSRDFPDDIEYCEHLRCLIAHDPDIYVMRFPDRAPEERFHPDGIWYATDMPWPGRDQCTVAFDDDPRALALAQACPF